MNIIETNLDFGPLAKRDSVDFIVLHHEEGHMDVYAVHDYHKNVRGWAGIGYNFFVACDGQVFRGRPIDTIGAHTLGYNHKSIGICAEGMYMTETMPEVQKQAIIELVQYCRTLYPRAEIKKHSDLQATDCPGTNYPFNEIVGGVLYGNHVPQTPETPYYNNAYNPPIYGVVTASELNVRTGPSADSSICDTLSKDASVKIGAKQGDWYSIYWGDNGAWVYASFIKIVDYSVTTSNKWVSRLQVCIDATQDGIPGPETLSKCPLLKYGSEGDIVRLVQEKLTEAGYDTNGVDGLFYNGTRDAVLRYQRDHGLVADGIIGTMSWSVLLGLK